MDKLQFLVLIGIYSYTSLMACFADINVSHVETYARCGGIVNIHLTRNLQGNLTVKKNFNRFRFDRIFAMSLWPHFLAHPVYFTANCVI